MNCECEAEPENGREDDKRSGSEVEVSFLFSVDFFGFLIPPICNDPDLSRYRHALFSDTKWRDECPDQIMLRPLLSPREAVFISLLFSSGHWS